MPTDFVGHFAMLAAARIRFVLVGGLALVLHGLDRLSVVTTFASRQSSTRSG